MTAVFGLSQLILEENVPNYLGFLARALIPLQDAGIHGLNIFYQQTKELIREAEGQLQAERRHVRNLRRDVPTYERVILIEGSVGSPAGRR